MTPAQISEYWFIQLEKKQESFLRFVKSQVSMKNISHIFHKIEIGPDQFLH